MKISLLLCVQIVLCFVSSICPSGDLIIRVDRSVHCVHILFNPLFNPYFTLCIHLHFWCMFCFTDSELYVCNSSPLSYYIQLFYFSVFENICHFFFPFYSIWKHVEVPGLGVKLELKLGPTLQPWQHGIPAASATYTAVCSNASSLMHWVRPGIEPSSSWTPCWLLNLLSHNRNSQRVHFILIISF